MHWKVNVLKSSKSDIIKYIFILFVVVLAISTYAIYQKTTSKANEPQEKKEEEEYNIIKELRLGIAEFDTINPLLSDNKNVQQISKLIFDSLITFDENYNFNYSLAKEISKTNNKEYVIKLKDNVYFQSGEKFTASDVEFTINMLKSNSSIYSENVKRIDKINVIDDTTLNITLNGEIPFFEYNLTFPILSKKFYEGEDFKSSSKNLSPTGTGMYRIDTTSDNVIKLVKNTSYWDINNRNPIIETININLYKNMGEVYNAFKNGNIDMCDTTLSSVKEYIGTLGYTAATYSTREFDYLVFNCLGNGALSDKYARRAINYAINKGEIVKKYYGDNYSESTFPLDYGNWVFSGSVDNKYSLDDAKRILMDGGWKYSNRRWTKQINNQTVELSFTITVNTTNKIDIQVAEEIKNQLSELGVTVKVKQVSKNNYYNYLNKRSGYEAIIVNINTSYSPNISTYMGEKNTSNYSSNEINELLKQAYSTGDSKTIKDVYSKIIAIYNTDVPFIGIARKNNVVVYNTNLVATTNHTAFNIFSKFQNWYRKN